MLHFGATVILTLFPVESPNEGNRLKKVQINWLVSGGTRKWGNGMNEYHVCGVVIHARHEKQQQIEQQLQQQPGVEVHASSGQGKLVVTVESEAGQQVADTIDQFKDIDGVLSASMIYQFCDQPNAINEGIPA